MGSIKLLGLEKTRRRKVFQPTLPADGLKSTLLRYLFSHKIHQIFSDKTNEQVAKLLFYGNEFTLLIFEMMTFVTFDLAFSGTKLAGSYFIAASITFLMYRGLV